MTGLVACGHEYPVVVTCSCIPPVSITTPILAFTTQWGMRDRGSLWKGIWMKLAGVWTAGRRRCSASNPRKFPKLFNIGPAQSRVTANWTHTAHVAGEVSECIAAIVATVLGQTMSKGNTAHCVEAIEPSEDATERGWVIEDEPAVEGVVVDSGT